MVFLAGGEYTFVRRYSKKVVLIKINDRVKWGFKKISSVKISAFK